MTLDEVLAVAHGSEVELSEEALAVIAESRTVVDVAVERGDAIYGVTTGVGHARDERVPIEALEMMQPVLVEMHVGALGDPMPRTLVRAGMVTRLNGFARGGSGVSLEVARSLEAILNNRIHPIIPRTGSVGSGDLGQLAFLGRAMLGVGQVERNGEIVDSGVALREAGISRVSLRPKDALAIISSNALAVGHGIVLSRSVDRLLKLADLVAALSMDAVGANPSVFDPAVAAARYSGGQIETSANLARFLAGSGRVDPATASVQDPLSLRVVPQVHGACRDVLTTAAGHLFDELNARSDNPLVDLTSERILSNGNFHAMNVALSAESLNLALCHVGLLSQRRMGQVWDRTVSSFGAAGAEVPAVEQGTPTVFAGLGLRYPAAAKYTRLRQLAQPITLDVPPLDLSVEDHATNAAEALWVTRQVVDILTELLTIEALVALSYLAPTVDTQDLGVGTKHLVTVITSEIDALPPGTPPNQTLEVALAAISEHLPQLVVANAGP